MVTRDLRVTLVRRDHKAKLAQRVTLARKARQARREYRVHRVLTDSPVLREPPDLLGLAEKRVQMAIRVRMEQQAQQAIRGLSATRDR
jgi:hypothetical protein